MVDIATLLWQTATGSHRSSILSCYAGMMCCLLCSVEEQEETLSNDETDIQSRSADDILDNVDLLDNESEASDSVEEGDRAEDVDDADGSTATFDCSSIVSQSAELLRKPPGPSG